VATFPPGALQPLRFSTTAQFTHTTPLHTFSHLHWVYCLPHHTPAHTTPAPTTPHCTGFAHTTHLPTHPTAPHIFLPCLCCTSHLLPSLLPFTPDHWVSCWVPHLHLQAGGTHSTTTWVGPLGHLHTYPAHHVGGPHHLEFPHLCTSTHCRSWVAVTVHHTFLHLHLHPGISWVPHLPAFPHHTCLHLGSLPTLGPCTLRFTCTSHTSQSGSLPRFTLHPHTLLHCTAPHCLHLIPTTHHFLPVPQWKMVIPGAATVHHHRAGATPTPPTSHHLPTPQWTPHFPLHTPPPGYSHPCTPTPTPQPLPQTTHHPSHTHHAHEDPSSPHSQGPTTMGGPTTTPHLPPHILHLGSLIQCPEITGSHIDRHE